jgi:hypothetical protein
MRRSLLLLIVLAAALVVPTAHASPPTFIPQPNDSFIDPTCGFDTTVDLASGETLRLFSNGNLLVTGPLTATFSANGKSVTVNASGPLIVTSGHTLFGQGITVGPIQLPDGRLTIATVAGTEDDSTFPAVLVHGTVLLDICAALSP